MWILLICQCKSKKWHNSFSSSWYSVSPSFLSLQLCFLTIPPISRAVAFSLWFMSQWGSLRCSCDKQGVWQIELWKNQPNISNFSACCFSTSFHKCLAVGKPRKRFKATALRASTCSLSLFFPCPTSHLCDCCAICAQIHFFCSLLEVPGSQTLPSCSCCALTFAALPVPWL